MKPNLLVINPSGSQPAPWVEALCNRWMEDCYVYLLCPGCGFREDNAHGVRFLPHDGTALPRFGHLDSVVAFEETEIVQRLRESDPGLQVRVISAPHESAPDLHAVREPVHARPLAA